MYPCTGFAPSADHREKLVRPSGGMDATIEVQLYTIEKGELIVSASRRHTERQASVSEATTVNIHLGPACQE